MVTLQGKGCYLAALEREDCRKIWRDTEYDFTHPVEPFSFGSAESADAWFEEIERLQNRQNIRLGIFLPGGEVVGDAALQEIDYYHRTASVGVGLAKLAHRGKGYGSQATRLLLMYGFCQLGLERITAATLDVNTIAQRALLTCGFTLEGTERSAVYFNAERHDRLHYAVLAAEYCGAGHVRK